MLDIKSYSQIKISSERNFGIVFTVFFAVLCIFFWLNNNTIYFIFLISSIITIFLTLLIPKSLIVPNILWNKFSILLGIIISPFIMAMIFFVTIVPTGLILRLLGRGPFKNKKNNKSSFWLEKDNKNFTMKNQF